MKKHLYSLKKLSILFVEDETVIREETTDLLHVFFSDVFVASNGKDAWYIYQDYHPDFVLSDINMPEIDGLTLANMIRSTDHITPIILLTAFSDQKKLFDAANTGIDGYILKPIELEELLHVFYKILERKPIIKKSIINLTSNIIYDTSIEELFVDSKHIKLGNLERKCLKLFIENPNRIISKEEIVIQIWPMDEITDSALKNLLNRLRNKIGFELIISIKGSGWRLNKSL